MRALSCLAMLAEVMIKPLKRELKSQVIRIGASRRLLQRFLVNDRGNDRKLRLLQNPCQGWEKPISRLRVLEDAEVVPWLADFSFMEDDLVMPPEVKFKTLKRRTNLLDITFFSKHAKRKDKYWVFVGDVFQRVITTLIHENNEIPMLPLGQFT
jgi:hypothetical protein